MEVPAAGGPAISASGLTVVRGGRPVLSDLDLTVDRGTVTGLLGPSGSGKSTLIRAVAGVQAHVRGQVTVLGIDAGAAEARRRVGYVTQASSVYPDLTVVQNLRYFASVSRADAASVDEAMTTVGLTGTEGRLARDLSGGQRARVSLAAALLAAPEVLLLDEPTVGLDPVLRLDLWVMFRRLADAGRTLLISSHVMDEAARCDRVLLLRDGALLADASPHGLRRMTGEQDLDAAFLALARESLP